LSAYDGFVARYVVLNTTLSTPSIPSASAQVTSSESSSESGPRSDRTKTSCTATPSTNIAGITTSTERNGSTCR
jgi:hypothetical protein